MYSVRPEDKSSYVQSCAWGEDFFKQVHMAIKLANFHKINFSVLEVDKDLKEIREVARMRPNAN